MKKITFLLALFVTLSWQGIAQYGCGSAVALTNGFTQTNITTPGTGGAEDWNTNPSGTSISSSYWDDDVYLFEYTAGTTTEQISMTILTRNGWNGIGIFDDCTGTTFSNELDASSAISGNTSQTVSAIISAGNTIYIAIGQYGTPNDLDFDVTSFTVTTISCPDPTVLQATNVSTTAADLAWTENGTATAWEIEWDTAGFTQGSGTSVQTTTNPHSLSGLTSNTSYEFYVRSACAANDSSAWVGPFSFSTACNALAIPFTENFSSTSSTLNCWRILDNNADNDTWGLNTSSSYVYSGDQSATMHTDFNGGANDDYLISPALTLTGGERLKFWYRARSASEPNDYQVLVSTTGTSPADFTDTILVDTANSTTYAQQIIDLSSYSGATYIAFHIPNGGLDGYYIYIDEVTVEAIPSCLAPIALTVTNVMPTSADLGWTENGTATTWDIEWDTAGFTQGAGTMVTGSTTNPHSLTGLTSNTSYEFYVRASCGGTDSSVWVGPYSFNTACNAFSVPFNEGFNSNSTSLGCWTIIDNNNDNDTWAINTSSSYVYSGDQSATMYTDYNAGANDDYLVSPGLTLTGAERLKFWYRARSTSEPNDYQVLVSTTGTSPADFTDTLLVDTANSTTYAEHVIDISAYSGVTYIAFHIPNGGLDGYYIYFDDFTVEAIPTCPKPTDLLVSNISTTSADLGWTEVASATAWEIEYDTLGFTPGTGTISAASTNPITIGSLTANTTYEFYVRSVCGINDSSIWVGPLSFTTTPDTISVFPYTNDIEAGLGNYLGLRTNAESDAFIDAAAASTGSFGIHLTGNSSNDFAGGSTSATEVQAFVTNASHVSGIDMIVDATSITTLTLKFDMKQTYSYGPNYSWGRVTVNGTQLGASVNPSTADADPFITVDVDLSAYVGTVFSLSIEHSGKYNTANGSGGNGDNGYIDNIVLLQPILASAIVDSNTTCLGVSDGGATASATLGTSPYTYAWSNGATTASITGLNGGNYTVTVTDAAGDTDSAMVTITNGTQAPVVSLGNDTSICDGATLSLDAGMHTTYTWDDASTMQTRGVSYVLGATTYGVTVTDTDGCQGSDDIVVTGFTMPTVNLGNDTIICADSSITLDAGAFTSYLWDDASTMQTRMTVSTLGAVEYSVEVTDANGCMAADTIEVTGNAPVMVDLGSDTSICNGAPYELDAGAGFASYFWNNGFGTQTLDVSSTTEGTKVYSVTVTDAMGCMGSDDATISVRPKVVVDLGNDTNVWANGVDTFALDAGAGFASYLWSDNVTSTQTYVVKRSTAGLVSVIVEDANGCEGTDTVSVTFAPVGVNEFAASTLKMYPNPAVDQVTVELSNMGNEGSVNVTFLTISGQVVMTEKVAVTGNNTVETFNVSSLATGSYLVRFESNGTVVTRQFVIK